MDAPYFDRLIDYRETPELEYSDSASTLVIHASETFFRDLAGYVPTIYREILDKAQRHGWFIVGIYGSDLSVDLITDDERHFHIAYLDRPCERHNLIHIVPSYFYDYWYVDPKGVRNHSSMREMHFDANTIDERAAHAFFQQLRQSFVEKNKTKWPQADLGSEPVRPNSVAVIMQAEKIFPYEERWLNSKDMISSAIATRGDRPLYIKPHPRAPIREQEALLEYHDPDNGVEVTVASIHDLLSNADYMVTQGSAVAIEANLHKTPAITAGQTDFWHNSVVVKDPSEMAAAVIETQTRKFEYEKYMYWFVHENLVFTDQFDRQALWKRLDRYGFPLAKTVLQS